jgi:NADPH:quinone reductase-like Zn-dependent oxidoreductase
LRASGVPRRRDRRGLQGRLFFVRQSPTAVASAWRDIVSLIESGSVKPIVEQVFPLAEAGEALRHLTDDRPFGKVVLEG